MVMIWNFRDLGTDVVETVPVLGHQDEMESMAQWDPEVYQGPQEPEERKERGDFRVEMVRRDLQAKEGNQVPRESRDV